jgi:hypothetical protein
MYLSIGTYGYLCTQTTIGLSECPHSVELASLTAGGSKEKARSHVFCDLVSEVTYCLFNHALLIRKVSLSLTYPQRERNLTAPCKLKSIKEFLDIV